MSAPISDLLARLSNADEDVRGLALGELVRRGKAATPALMGALRHADARVRALAAEGLGQIADPAAANALYALLSDSDEKVRSHAATSLARIGDPRGVPALLRTLNDNHDLLRAHLSLSAYTLMALGRDVLPSVAPLLRAADEPTRTKAIWIIRMIAEDMPAEAPGWSAVAAALKRYDENGSAADQSATARRLMDWLREHPVA